MAKGETATAKAEMKTGFLDGHCFTEAKKDRQKDRQTYIHTDRQIDRQTFMAVPSGAFSKLSTCVCVCVCMCVCV